MAWIFPFLKTGLAASVHGGAVERRLARMGLELPDAPTPVANYSAFIRNGNHVAISGQVSAGVDSVSALGKLGAGLTVEEGYAAARIAALNVLAHLRVAADGSLDRVEQCMKVAVFVSSSDDFFDHPRVADGASDLFVSVFGDAGRGSRAAVGVAALPLNYAVEVVSEWRLRPRRRIEFRSRISTRRPDDGDHHSA